MAGMYGMDVDQINALGTLMRNKAEEIRTIASTITSQLQSAQWMGPDAERFRSDWSGQHMQALNTVATAVMTAGDLAIKNAGEQQTTSA